MDPYAQYHEEISTAILSLATLHTRFTRLISTTPPSQHATSQPISYALAELRANITTLQLDLEELEESVGMLENDGEIARRLGLGEQVVRERRKFVDSVNAKINVRFCSLEGGNVDAYHFRFPLIGYSKDAAYHRFRQSIHSSLP